MDTVDWTAVRATTTDGPDADEIAALRRDKAARGAHRGDAAPAPPWKVTLRRPPAPKPLRPGDFAVCEAFIELMWEKLNEAGVTVEVGTNFSQFVTLRSAASPDTPINPTYDPRRVQVSLRNAFWFRAVDATTGETVAMIAHRVFDTADLFSDLTALRLWHDGAGLAERCVFRALDLDVARGIAGRVAHSGGLWIRPDWRKRNLSGYLDHLGRAMMIRNFWFDYMTGLIPEKLAATGIGIRQYGFPGIVGWIEFDFFNFVSTKLAYCQMNRAESLHRMKTWLGRPSAETIAELYT
jgi:hypothetical protein